MKNSIFSRALKNVFRNKINIISIVLLSICSAIIIFGFSYVGSMRKLWDDWTRKSIDFRIYFVSYDYNLYTEEEAVAKLKTYEHIQDATTSAGYYIYGIIDEFVDANFDGWFEIRGATKDSISLIAGHDFSKKGENELICPNKFVPNSQLYTNDFNKIKNIDLPNYVGKTIKISIPDEKDKQEEFKIVGLYDVDYSYSSGYNCYATFDTVKKLNNKYYPDTFKISDTKGDLSIPALNVVIDSTDNVDEIAQELEKDGFSLSSPSIVIKTEIGDNVMRIILILTWVTAILSLIIILLIFLKRINDQNEEIAINKAIGYTKKDINKVFYLESIIISIISFIISIVLAIIALVILKNYYLVTISEFSRMKLTFNTFGLILSLIVSFTIPLISVFIATRKIDKINIIKMLREE